VTKNGSKQRGGLRRVIWRAGICISLLIVSWCLGDFGLVYWQPFIRQQAKQVRRDEGMAFIDDHWDYYDRVLRVGALRSEIEPLLPLPDNTNTDHVLYWAAKYLLRGASINRDWREMLNHPSDAVFIVFINGRLATPLLPTSADWTPVNALANFGQVSDDEATRLLEEK
jgi:hypothetical protein